MDLENTIAVQPKAVHDQFPGAPSLHITEDILVRNPPAKFPLDAKVQHRRLRTEGNE